MKGKIQQSFVLQQRQGGESQLEFHGINLHSNYIPINQPFVGSRNINCSIVNQTKLLQRSEKVEKAKNIRDLEKIVIPCTMCMVVSVMIQWRSNTE